MKLRLLTGTLVLFALLPLAAVAQDSPLPASLPRPSRANIQQWRDRKFGMFIHFGLFSEFGGMYHGQRVDAGYSEQIMGNAPIPLDEYEAAAKTFDPTQWDPDAIVALAKAAGMKYIVITAKHHDGFNMFATKQTKYNIVDDTPYHRDIVKSLADACKRGGLAFGVYYSSIDWHQPGMDHYIPMNSNVLSDAHARFNAAQIRELMTNYGPISEIWFDMGKPTPEQSRLFATTVHDLQPQTMVSGRVWNNQGDFTVMADNQIPQYTIDEPWQSPASIFPETWGYRSWQKRDNLNGKIEEDISKLVQVVSHGGNFILNIGPKGDGSVVPFEADVLRGIGAWLKINGGGIYGTTASPFETLGFGYATQKGNDIYLFVKDKTKPLVLPRSGDTKWASAVFLANGQHLHVQQSGGDTVILPPDTWPDGFLPVVKLASVDGVKLRPSIPHPDASGRYTLTAGDAETFYNYNGRGYMDPETLYKLRWYLPQGCASVTLYADKDGPVSLFANGVGKTEQASQVKDMKVMIGADNVLELTPPEPFVKGTALSVGVEGLFVTPCNARNPLQDR